MTPIQAGYNEHSLSLQTPRRIEIYIALLNHPPGGGVTWVNSCWICAAGLSEPLPHYILFSDQL